MPVHCLASTTFELSETVSQLTLDLTDTVEYRLVVSNRARRASLRVDPGRGVVVTIPRCFARRDVPAFVESHRAWIESTLADIERQTPARFRQWPPRRLLLPAINRVLCLSYPLMREPSASCVPGGACVDAAEPAAESVAGCQDEQAGTLPDTRQMDITLNSDPASKEAVATELSVLLKRQAGEFFPVRLGMLAERHGLSYRRVQIRGQRTLWGSCSSSGTISLNYKLLFLPWTLVDYVLLHELAHTRHLDHSPAFWRQLQSMQPDAQALDAQLGLAGREVPPWLELAK